MLSGWVDADGPAATAVQCIALQAKAVLFADVGQNHQVAALLPTHRPYLPCPKNTGRDLHDAA
jgi:hypothetical protein